MTSCHLQCHGWASAELPQNRVNVNVSSSHPGPFAVVATSRKRKKDCKQRRAFAIFSGVVCVYLVACIYQHDLPTVYMNQKLMTYRSNLWTKNYTSFWNDLDELISNTSLYPADYDTTIAINALQNAKVKSVDLYLKRTSFKWIMVLEGGQKVLFKPSVISKTTTYDKCNRGCEKPENEVAGYTIYRMLRLFNFPFTTGRNLHWFTELEPVASKRLRQMVNVTEDGDVCMTIECFRIFKPIRPCFKGGMIGGAMIYFLRRNVDHLKKYDDQFHPFYLRDRNTTFNEEYLYRLLGDDSYCKEFRSKDVYNDPSIFAHILDITVLSFITNHRDQKPFTAKTSTTPLPIVFDYGYGFCEPSNYDIRLAAPIYQCCNIRKSTYLLLQTLHDTFPQQFEELTKEDPLYPLLQSYHIQDVTRRIKLLLTLVDYCVLYRGYDNVVKETFEN